MTSRAASKAQSRTALIAAGMRLFREHGLDGPSLDAICAEAGYTRGAFYGHFPDREAFQVAVMKEVGGPIVAALTASADGDGITDIALRFATAFATGTYPLAPAGGIRPHQLFAACARSPSLRDHYVELVDDATKKIASALRRDQQRGRVRDDVDADAIAKTLLILVVGAQSLAELDVPLDIAATSAALLTLLSPGPA